MITFMTVIAVVEFLLLVMAMGLLLRTNEYDLRISRLERCMDTGEGQ